MENGKLKLMAKCLILLKRSMSLWWKLGVEVFYHAFMLGAYGSRLSFGGLGGLSLQSLFLHARTAAREEKGTSAPPLDSFFCREL